MTNVFIISAPSGSGKSTLVNRLLTEVPGLVFSISYTTRGPRGKELDGSHYFFIDQGRFEEMLARDEFLEHAVLFGKDMYGTARRFYDEACAAGSDLVLDIDVQGAAQVKSRIPEATSIFILPPSRDELAKRLRKRGEDAEEVIERRLRRAVREIENYPKYDYVIINDDRERAGEKLCAIVLAARWTKRNKQPLAGDNAGGQNAGGDAAGLERWRQLAESCLTQNAAEQVAAIRQTFVEASSSESR